MASYEDNTIRLTTLDLSSMKAAQYSFFVVHTSKGEALRIDQDGKFYVLLDGQANEEIEG